MFDLSRGEAPMQIRHLFVVACALAWGLVAADPAAAQDAREAGEARPAPGVEAHAGPADPYDRGVPRSAMHGYLEACRQGDFARAAGYLDLRRLRPGERDARGPELARSLKAVLDRELWVDLDALSNEPGGLRDDGLPASRERLGAIETRKGPVPILLQRVPQAEDGVPVWKIASTTVERIPALYAEFGPGPLEEWLPRWMLDLRLLEVALWQWCALLALVVAAAALSWVAIALLDLASRPLTRRSRTDVDDRLVRATAGPLRLAAAIALFRLGTLPLGLAVPARELLRGVEDSLLIVAVTWFLWRLVNLFTLVVARRLDARGNAMTRGVVPLGQKGVKAFLLLLAGIALLDSFGFDVTALLAGLGVGGIAVALAAQRTVENLFGGVSILADRPVSVGDFCRFGDRVGTVEEIGLRSTRIRSLERTLVTIPNAEFSRIQIENFAARDKLWYHPTLGLRYETTPDQLRYVLIEIRRMLYAHPKVDPDPARVRFTGFGAYSLDLEVFAYVRTRDWGEYLEIAEDLNLRIMDIVEASGSGFAFPSQTLYLGRDEGLDAKRVAEAETRVREWRERRELYLPRFPEELVRELGESLAYPVEGSPDHRARGARG
jgi:MscS family membrane protein